MQEKDLKLERLNFKVEPRILIDSINSNSHEWMIDKTIEELIGLAHRLMEYKRGLVAQEQICQPVANVVIQMDMMGFYFNTPLIQKFINKRLVSINNRSERINGNLKKFKEIGFEPMTKGDQDEG